MRSNEAMISALMPRNIHSNGEKGNAFHVFLFIISFCAYIYFSWMLVLSFLHECEGHNLLQMAGNISTSCQEAGILLESSLYFFDF